jgi:hypothetical protein
MQFQQEGAFNDNVELWLVIIILGPWICRHRSENCKEIIGEDAFALWTREKEREFAVFVIEK